MLIHNSQVSTFWNTGLIILIRKSSGDQCTDDRTSTSGVCQLIDNCASAKENIQNGVFPKVCGFQGNQVVVCCSAPAPVKKSNRTPGEKAAES